MRELTSHKVNGLNEAIAITVKDEPGPGGACHEYGMSLASDTGYVVADQISFQKGPVRETGVNGISNEALLAIVEDRILGFQAGEFACRENTLALVSVQQAMHWLHHRTRARLARGVEGVNQA